LLAAHGTADWPSANQVVSSHGGPLVLRVNADRVELTLLLGGTDFVALYFYERPSAK
jgi:hypothetical protein